VLSHLHAGYWRLVNKGILHRDISDGNVLMLRGGQNFVHREWQEPRTTGSKPDDMVAKSEDLLQGIIERLNRDPVGMLTDFDLHTTHIGMKSSDPRVGQDWSDVQADSRLPVVSDTARDKELGDSALGQHRTNAHVSVPIHIPDSGVGKGRQALEPMETSNRQTTEVDEGRKDVDYRTVSVMAWFYAFC
jgi:hypothetical protein